MDTSNTSKPLTQQGKDVADAVASKMQGGIQSTQQAANKTLDKAGDQVDEAKSNVAPMLDSASDQAQKLMQQGRDALNDTTQLIREKANQASDLAVGYAKDEPLKAILIAAAAGALLMGLVTMMSRSRD